MSDNTLFNISDMRFDDIDFSQPINNTYVSNDAFWKSNVNNDLILSTGKYKLTIGNPTGNVNEIEKSFSGVAAFVDNDGQIYNKNYDIYKWDYDVQKNKLYLYLDLKQNPIPIFILYGAIAITLMVAGAISVNSVLEHVEKLSDNVTSNLLSSPVIWAIVAIFLIPVLISGYKVVKK